MKEFFIPLMTAAFHAVFLRNLIFSGGFGTSEVIRAARRNSEISLTAVMVGIFSAVVAALSRFVETEFFPRQMAFAWRSALYAFVLLWVYITVCGLVVLLPRKIAKWRPLFLKRIGMSVLNTLVMAVPILANRMGDTLPRAIGTGVGAGVAFFVVALLINSGMHILQANRSIPTMFSGIPANLIYIGLLALAFTGLTGEILFQ